MPTPRLQLTSKDFAQLRAELISNIPITTGGGWTDENESDPGIAIIEAIAAYGEILLFQCDQSVNEAQFVTAQQRRSVRNLAALIGYFPPTIAGARGVVEISATSHSFGGATVSIPPYTKVATAASNGVSFVTLTEDGATDPEPVPVVLSATRRTVRMAVVQGDKGSDAVTSDGAPSQRYRLSAVGIDASTVLAYVNGQLWTTVASFAQSDLNSQHVAVGPDDVGNVYATFGDGVFGQIPPLSAAVRIDYVISSGRAGSAGAGKIVVLLDKPLDSNSAPVTDLSITNPERTGPGSEAESVDRTKLLAPASLAALGTAKSRSDYETLMLLADPAVRKTRAWGEAEEVPPNIHMLNRVKLCFTGRGVSGGVLDPALSEYSSVRSAVAAYLDARRIVTTRNAFVAPIYVHIRVTATVAVDFSRFDPAAVAAACRSAVYAAFGFDAVGFGQDVYPSQVQKAIDSVEGVSWSSVSLSTADPTRAISGGGILVHRDEVPILEEDEATGLSSAFADSHVVLTFTDAKDLPVPDLFG